MTKTQTKTQTKPQTPVLDHDTLKEDAPPERLADIAQAAAYALGVGNWEKVPEGKLLISELKRRGYGLVVLSLTALALFTGCAQSTSLEAMDCPAPELVEGVEPCDQVDSFSPPTAAGWWQKAEACFQVVDGQPVIYFVDDELQSRMDTLLDYEYGQWAEWCAQ